MTRRVLIVVVMVMAAITAWGQENQQEDRRFGYGLRAGVNLSDITDPGCKMVVRTHIGAMVSYRMSDFFSLGAEMLYTGGGTSMYLSIPSEGITDDVHLNLNYISIPILAKFRISNRLSLHSGIEADFAVMSKINYRGEKIESPLETNIASLSVPMGVTYDFSHGITATFRYNLGVTDIFSISDYKNIRNSICMFSVGYMF